ncbi:MAG: tRNA 2-thiouridine(34) synthase MnmA, partial [Actinomycetales bacterium]|nr:tRNA 2-thiouridine(34) synthase MnmA [Actinomycetales bacterium]
IVTHDDGSRELHRASDLAKDQSYVLAVMGPERLARSMFPLGEVASKDEVRAEAAARGLSVSAKPDSYDICFVADGDTQGFLRERLGSQPGPIVDATGEVLGEHDGAYAYTVGQRRGLSIGRPAPDGKPRYVLSIEPVRNTVVVGSREDLEVDVLEGHDALWFAVVPEPDRDVQVQVRAHGTPVPARVERAWFDGAGFDGTVSDGALSDGTGSDGGARVRVRALEPLTGVAPGQSLVVYDGTRVLGQATVSSATRG